MAQMGIAIGSLVALALLVYVARLAFAPRKRRRVISNGASSGAAALGGAGAMAPTSPSSGSPDYEVDADAPPPAWLASPLYQARNKNQFHVSDVVAGDRHV